MTFRQDNSRTGQLPDMNMYNQVNVICVFVQKRFRPSVKSALHQKTPKDLMVTSPILYFMYTSCGSSLGSRDA